MNSRDVLQAQRADILRVATLHGARNVRIFGSVAPGDEEPSSDVDLLVEFEEGRSVLDLAGLWQDLEELPARKVDVVEPEGLHWYVRDGILKEAVPL
jgi:hypothetical protein